MHNLALSSDELILAVCGMSDERGLLLSFYDVRTIFNEVPALERTKLFIILNLLVCVIFLVNQTVLL